MKFLCLFFTFLATACGGGGGAPAGLPLSFVAPPTAPAAPAAPARSDCTLVLYGDSVFNGFSSKGPLDEFPAATLKRLRPKYTVESRTLSADSYQRRAPLFANETTSARFVVIELGIVDAINGYPLEANMRSVIQRSRALGATAVIVGLPPTEQPIPNADAYNATERSIAESEGVPFVNLRDIAIHPGDTADGVHPVQALSNLMVEKTIATLDGAASECK